MPEKQSYTHNSDSHTKAIQTRYAGHHFRSRLEARWAVFFDALGIKWTYEPEGYNLKGGYYLPDFYLEDFDCFCEVKPASPELSYMDKYMDLVADSGDPLMLLISPKVQAAGHSYLQIADYETFRVEAFHGAKFVCCYRCDRVLINGDDFWGGCKCKPCADADHQVIQNAVTAAKSARFEFGHKGAS